MATHSVFLPEEFHEQGAWRATAHGSQRVRHDRATNTHTSFLCKGSSELTWALSHVVGDICVWGKID